MFLRFAIVCLALSVAGVVHADTPKRIAEKAAIQKVRDEYKKTKDPQAVIRSFVRLAEGDEHNFLAYLGLIKLHGMRGDADLVRHYARCAARYQFAAGEAGDSDLLKAAEEDAIVDLILQSVAEMTPAKK